MQYGPANVLTIEELERPKRGKNEVLVKVEACSPSPRDATIRIGEFKWLAGRNFAMLICADLSGTVVSVGERVTDFHAGEGVFDYMQNVQKGCSAEYVAVPQDWIAKKPKFMQHAVAAAIPCAYLVGLHALRNKAKIKEGNRLLIYGASGSVGTAAIQLAKHFKALVTAACSAQLNNISLAIFLSLNKHMSFPFLKSLGCIKPKRCQLQNI
jgi:NADPH:quinone reductase-like Zn-dependent oxidoreductase